jgi:hypothetical protein
MGGNVRVSTDKRLARKKIQGMNRKFAKKAFTPSSRVTAKAILLETIFNNVVNE